jgi:ribosomal protein L3
MTRVTTQNLKVVKTDAERGLIMVEGFGPWRQGRLDHGARRREEIASRRRARCRPRAGWRR